MKDTNTGAVKETNKSAIFSWLGTPPAGELIPLSLQHVAAMVIGCVTPAIIIAGVCNLSSSDTVILIQSALLISAARTIYVTRCCRAIAGRLFFWRPWALR